MSGLPNAACASVYDLAHGRPKPRPAWHERDPIDLLDARLVTCVCEVGRDADPSEESCEEAELDAVRWEPHLLSRCSQAHTQPGRPPLLIEDAVALNLQHPALPKRLGVDCLNVLEIEVLREHPLEGIRDALVVGNTDGHCQDLR